MEPKKLTKLIDIISSSINWGVVFVLAIYGIKTRSLELFGIITSGIALIVSSVIKLLKPKR